MQYFVLLAIVVFLVLLIALFIDVGKKHEKKSWRIKIPVICVCIGLTVLYFIPSQLPNLSQNEIIQCDITTLNDTPKVYNLTQTQTATLIDIIATMDTQNGLFIDAKYQTFSGYDFFEVKLTYQQNEDVNTLIFRIPYTDESAEQTVVCRQETTRGTMYKNVLNPNELVLFARTIIK